MNQDDNRLINLSLNVQEIMLSIDPSSIPSWKSEGGLWVPSCVDTICPFCHKPTTLDTELYCYESHTNTMGMFGRCTRCQGKAKIWAIEVQKQTGPKTCQEIWMLPKPSVREPITLTAGTPHRISKAYQEAVVAFNNGLYPLAVTSCGKVIEGIAKNTFPGGEGKKQIGQLFRSLEDSLEDNADYKDLLQPFLDVGRTFRLGRNIGAHFDLEKDADRDVAQDLLELTEFFLRYIYVISYEAAETNNKIEALGPDDSIALTE